MIMDYLTNKENLIKKMIEWGFKRKNKNIFRRIERDAVLDFYFSHYTRGANHVKYYTINVNVWYPEIDRVKKGGHFYFGIPNSIIWNDLGHLMGAPVQKEYGISDDEDETSVNMVVERICSDLSVYALPIMERYSSIYTLIDDFEKGLLERFHVSKQTMALLYLIYSGKAKASDYVCQQLILLRRSESGEPGLTIHEGKIAGMDSVTVSVKGNELALWEDLYEKIKAFH